MSNPEKQSVGPDAKELEDKAREETAVAMEVNPEETRSDDEELEVGDEEEEAMIRELVLGLPALRLQDEFGDKQDQDDDNTSAAARGKASAAEVAAAAEEDEEAGDKGKREKEEEKGSGSGGKKRSKKPKTDAAGASGSGSGEAKPKKRAPELIDPPAGPPICPYCQRVFGSWKAVFGHLRAHKERQHHGFLPPPRFSAAAEGITIGGSGGGGGGSGGSGSAAAAASAVGGSGGGGDATQGGARGLGFDLNALPDEAPAEETNVPNPKPFDLNKSPPKEDDPDKDKA